MPTSVPNPPLILVPDMGDFSALKRTVADLGTRANTDEAKNASDALRIAKLEAAVLALQGAVPVVVPPVPPVVVVPPPVSAAWPHEPAGMTLIEDRGWETGFGSWFPKFTSPDKPIRIVPITDSKLGEASALELFYAQGHVGGGGTELESARFPAVRELYVGFWAQVSPNWQGHNTAINKLVYLADDAVGFHAMWPARRHHAGRAVYECDNQRHLGRRRRQQGARRFHALRSDTDQRSMILLALLLQVAPVRTYWPATVPQLASGTFKHTHVAVTGIVGWTRIQEDGDLHIHMVADTGAVFVKAECIPTLPCRRPRNGERITVKGISRRDPEHGWWEVHPVELGP